MAQIKDALNRLVADPLPRILMLSHGIGGGVERHVNELIEVLNGYAHVLLLEPVPGRPMLRLTLPNINATAAQGEAAPLMRLAYRWPKDAAVFWQLINWLNLSRLHIHHTQGYAADFWPQLHRQLTSQGLAHDVTLHDHSIFTGHVSLVNKQGVFDPAWLKQGLAHLPQGDQQLARSLQDLVLSAERVIVPSAQLKQAVQDLLPAVAQASCLLHRGHPDAEYAKAYPQPYLRALEPQAPLRVLCLGMLNIEKGAGVLAQVAELAQAVGAPLEFILLGSCHVPLPKTVKRWGSYADAQVHALLAEIDPHLVWLPAQCPETWSYTLSAAFKSGLPVLASDIGVFPERLQGRPLSWQCSHRATAQHWLQELLAIRALHFTDLNAGFWSWLPPPAFYLQLPALPIAAETAASLASAYWQVAEVSPAIAMPSTLEHSLAAAEQRAERGVAQWRTLLLAVLSWLRNTGCLAVVVRIIPYRWQQAIKRLISRAPLTERGTSKRHR